jgi:hypothetical protein
VPTTPICIGEAGVAPPEGEGDAMVIEPEGEGEPMATVGAWAVAGGDGEAIATVGGVADPYVYGGPGDAGCSPWEGVLETGVDQS